MQVIPALNCADVHCIIDKLHVVKEQLGDDAWVHLDVTDACFTFNKTWGDPKIWREVVDHIPLSNISLEVHLMVEKPEKVVEAWLEAGAKRIIVHVEAMEDFDLLKNKCKEKGAELMLSLIPETPVQKLEPYFEKCQSYQVLAVHPGLAGQKFLPVALEKIKFLRERLPDATIEVDGGINVETGIIAKAHGANVLISASTFFDSPDPKIMYEHLMHL